MRSSRPARRNGLADHGPGLRTATMLYMSQQSSAMFNNGTNRAPRPEANCCTRQAGPAQGTEGRRRLGETQKLTRAVFAINSWATTWDVCETVT